MGTSRSSFALRAGLVGRASLAAILCTSVACDSSQRKGNGSGEQVDGGGALLGDDSGITGSPDGEGHLVGKVVAPEGTIPIAGALVYLSIGDGSEDHGLYFSPTQGATAQLHPNFTQVAGQSYGSISRFRPRRERRARSCSRAMALGRAL